ncbi:MAG TPA: bifunctional UDP-N-acetylglucosamine diphosphorylase/glucosamine-1-phosphate N-acetyltransferase GlmU, partial [Actinomycetota bacterium]|nr:bifunctional UDP-N-acetylglucosamine diphosphorylase/glucosamine-1-phosphate N-acetyltransferase GlmU [Actinomycetota bacterium]
DVEAAVRSWNLRLPIKFVRQDPPLGTGHAVMVAEKDVGRTDDVLVLPGDNPLITADMLRSLIRLHRRRDPAVTVLSTEVEDPKGYWRLIRKGDRFEKVVEESAATEEELASREVATSVYAFRREDLFRVLPRLDRDNREGEYYLPDVLDILAEKGEDIRVQAADFGGALDVNSRSSLARATTVMRRRINEALMDKGVTMVDPERTYIEPGVTVGPDTTILPDTHLEGDTRIGEGCRIGPGSVIAESRVADGATVELSVVRGSKIGPRAVVGPYAHIRPETVLGADTKAGSFVEIKASRIGDGSKVPHLSYIGDATLGRNVNIGAGTVTVNYDGYDKHRTVIGDDVRIGSDTMLIAPVKIGRGAVTGAGSVISKDVPAGALAVERADQRTVRGYRAKKDRERRSRRGDR